MMPMSFTVASAQLRGQPETASFTLRRRPRAAQIALELDAEAGRILRAEPAPLAADAGLHRAQALGVGLAGDQARGVELRPHRRQVFLPDAEQVDALAAGDLDGRNLELVGDVGDGAQLVRRRQAAPHARHHRERAVLLDVGVHALVDEARLRDRRGIRPARRRADSSSAPAGRTGSRTRSSSRAPASRPERDFSSFDRMKPRTSSWVRSMHLHIGLRAGGRIGGAQRRRPAAPRPSRCTGRRRPTPWCRAHVVERGQAARGDRLRDHALADAVAAADLRIVRERRDQPPPDRAARRRPDTPGRRSACRASCAMSAPFFSRSKYQAPSAVSP